MVVSQDTSPVFHTGELAMQRAMRVDPEFEEWARQVVRPCMPDQHRDFFAELPFVVIAARDAHSRPWLSLLSGPPGFATSPQPRALHLTTEPVAGDALAGSLGFGAQVGLVGLDFATRRRNRMNGRITSSGPGGQLEFEVSQSFGNCPQHISERAWHVTPGDLAPSTATRHGALTADAVRLIEAADTFFIGSGFEGEADAPSTGLDASHRGGPSGFVHVLDDRTLSWPEFAGNNHFNTLGNLHEDPRVALLFIDFESGHLLQITGRAAVETRKPGRRRDADPGADNGAPHTVTVHIEALVWLEHAHPLRWRELTDTHAELQVIAKRRESRDASSFVLRPLTGASAPSRPGQHLPVEVTLPGGTIAQRTYSLSGRPDGDYRLTVKRLADGVVSRYLHDTVEVGDVLRAGRPTGEFVLREGTRPVVLIGAGVGLTPLVPMLEALKRDAPTRRAQLIYATRSSAHLPLDDEVHALTDGPRSRHLVFSAPRTDDRPGHDYDHEGRLDAGLLAALVEDASADFYLCGPTAFMADVQGWLRDLGVADDHISYERF